ncbi:phosphoglucosamine mutase [Halorussus gelatinilyticus]|uniref:Phosphoglucosamine mutase n=1 Tax=Halorussus gelatinilyticus TaxID=2937524 RepID=A0A8U0IIA7_9EURY|nr:phosphoglucosamine mutase [Halorussus gelatinilyticus]UPW00401.1 phosphoglucosamine mutase [Halorussus gelatinilyticus]
MFGTSGVRGRIGDEVTCDLALAVGRALASEGYRDVVVGRDARESGRMLADAAVSGLRECGADVIRLGEAATPTVARSVGWRDADAGLMVTASHNPAPDNGLKLWNPSGQAFDERQREAIAARVREEKYDLRAWDGLGEATTWDDADERHARAVTSAAAPGNCSIVVDVGNGVGQVTAEALRRLGHDVRTLNDRPDGSFPARPSEPTAENCRGLSRFVAATDADLGIAHDGDADRMRAATESGEFVAGDLLLALFAREAANPGDEVAVPVDTSLTVADCLEAQGASVSRTRVGDVYVAERATGGGVAFGGEPSGAWIWPGETLCPDGPLAACRLAGLVARRGSLDRLVGEIETYPLERGNVETDRKAAAMERVRERLLGTYDDVNTLDGVRVGTEDGWFLVRASGTQPLIRVTAEARNEERTEKLFAEAETTVEEAIRAVERASAEGESERASRRS